MPDSLQKLQPDRDLQCFYFQPTAIAALSNCSPTGFTLSGTWRQQFDWAVVEWNRDNVYEHPLFRNLPDGDLSGLTLTYEETRTNCIPLDSSLFATVDWPSLRVWGPKDGVETVFWVRLMDHAEAIEGSYAPAYADFTLSGSGTPAAGTYAGIAYLDTHYTYSFDGSHSLADALAAIQDAINLRPNPFQPTLLRATVTGSTIRVYYTGGPEVVDSTTGHNGNRFGMYSYSTTPAGTWDAAEKTFANGTSPTKWRITLDFGALQGYLNAQFTGSLVDLPRTEIRKMRWTYAADLQEDSFDRSEFEVVVSNWTVTGTGRAYFVAGPGSRRIENNSPEIVYADNVGASGMPQLASGITSSTTSIDVSSASTAQVNEYLQIDSEVLRVTAVLSGGTTLNVTRAARNSVAAAHSAGASVFVLWSERRGNYSGGSIHRATIPGDSVSCTYTAATSHSLYLGTRFVDAGATVTFTVDGSSIGDDLNLAVPTEDVLIRWPMGTYAAGSHTVTVASTTSGDFYFDFFELAVPTVDLPSLPAEPSLTLATDWDTLHSISIAPERTAWFLDSLGFIGRQNHYVGALWFYELAPVGFTYASGTVTFSGTVDVTSGNTLKIKVGRDDTSETTDFLKLMHVGDTPETLAIAYAQAINSGSTGIWASAASGVLTITARAIGSEGSHYTLAYESISNPDLTVTISGTPVDDIYPFTTAADGKWRTDLVASPRLNRAVRDWTLSFSVALQGYGIDTVSALSMELGNGDDSVSAGIAQRGPSGDPILLPTPAVQTNFSPTSLDFWKEVYLELAGIQAAAKLTPFLQFGEVQWWYFPSDGLGLVYSGMPFYDAWNQTNFESIYGHPMATITTNTVDPADYPDESAYLPSVIGNFTDAIMTHVRATYSDCRFEVLYPTDVNQTAFNQVINYPTGSWTPSALTLLKTESFGFTFNRNLDQSETTIEFGGSLGFGNNQRSHLVGVGDSTTSWLKEARSAVGRGFESVVLFALDQLCLIGYRLPLPRGLRRSFRVGS